jgi:predicted GTPase
VIAPAEADVVIAVLDATQEPLPADCEAVKLLRQSSKPASGGDQGGLAQAGAPR